MRLFALMVLAAVISLGSAEAEAGGCGSSCGPCLAAGTGYVPPSCYDTYTSPPLAAVIRDRPPIAAQCEVRDLVNQGQFYSQEPIIVQRVCHVPCAAGLVVVAPSPVATGCWR